jgi:hypothetical protein
MYKGKSAYNDVVQTKDMQIAQVGAGLHYSSSSRSGLADACSFTAAAAVVAVLTPGCHRSASKQ